METAKFQSFKARKAEINERRRVALEERNAAREAYENAETWEDSEAALDAMDLAQAKCYELYREFLAVHNEYREAALVTK